MNAAPLDAAALVNAFASASEHLSEQARAIDAINVYPVPDGDTGSNMAATLREAVHEAQAANASRVGPALAALARGALFGARGNSGVILSQALKGFATAAEGAVALDGAVLAAGLTEASQAAYAAVSQPVEGTMLTVLRESASGALAAAVGLPSNGASVGCLPVLRAAIEAAEEAERHTPEQLPALAEAGVTDSGGEGICVILRGLEAALRGERPPAAVIPDRPLADLASHESEEFGFCTEFMVEPDGAPLDQAQVRAALAGERSLVVVGDQAALRVHLHSDDPEAVFATAATFGRVSRAKAEDMGAQHGRYQATGTGASAKTAVLAFSPGPGFDTIFESLGARVVRMDDVVKPAAGDIAETANALGAAEVIVLPNHKNVVMAARQAVALARCSLAVVASESLPQGIAAALAFDSSRPLAVCLEDMEEAVTEVVTIEVTTAAADRSADGVTVAAGDAIGLVNGRLVARAAAPLDALIAALNRVADDGSGLITLYGGAELDEQALARAAAAVQARFRDASVEAVHGGQRLYRFIASVEK